MFHKNIDVYSAVVVAGIAALIATLGLSQTVAGPVPAALLVLFAPGCAAQAALVPHQSIGIGMRLTLSLGISLSLAVLGGFVLNWTPAGLTPLTWVLLLGALTVGAGATALVRRGHQLESHARPRSNRIPVRGGLFIGLAAIFVVGAFLLDSVSVANQPRDGFTQLWMLPAGDAGGAAVKLGVHNMESSSGTYDVKLQIGNQTFKQWSSITLQPNETWTTTLALPAETNVNAPIEADLFLGTATTGVSQPYRHVILWPSQHHG